MVLQQLDVGGAHLRGGFPTNRVATPSWVRPVAVAAERAQLADAPLRERPFRPAGALEQGAPPSVASRDERQRERRRRR